MAKKKEDKETKQSFDLQMKELEKKYSMRRGKDIVIEPKIRTGVYALDYVLDGGIAQCEGGHKIELYGKEGCGKSTMALQIIAKYQALGKKCVYINAENRYDPTWAEMNGVDNEQILIVKPTTMEVAGDMIVDLIPQVDLIIVDSVAALIPEEELTTSLEDKHYASQAKVASPMCRKIQVAYRDYKTTIIFINQIREKVGVMYGNPEITPSGKSIKFLCESRIDMRASKPITVADVGETEETKNLDKKEKLGIEITLTNKKNNIGTPHRNAIVDFYFVGRYDNRKSLLFAGVKYGVIEFSGKTYQYKDLKAVGQNNFKELLTPEILTEIENEVWKVAK